MKQFKTLAVLAAVLAFAMPAYAETQNVKVSGSIDAYAFYRGNYDLVKNNDSGMVAAPSTSSSPQSQSHSGTTTQRSDGDAFFHTNTQLEVAADLTDNVSTVINLVNQRDWNADNPNLGTSAATNEFDIELDLAYVKMKEIFYSPLTLTIGRQDIWLGRGFVIGNNNAAWDSQGITFADEYSVTTAFDAIRATLDFNPWTIDLAYSKITEASHNSEDDIDLWIANVNYKFAEYNAVAEGYWVSQIDKNALSGATTGNQDQPTHTIGGRVQFDPISQITLGGELAYQFGDFGRQGRNRDAWGLDIFGTYRFDMSWKPELTLEYVSFSGEEDLSSSATGDYGSWNALYRGHFWTAYADFREFLYGTGDGVDQSATQNSQFVQLKGALKPLDDLLLEGSFTYLWNNEAVHTGATSLGSAAYLATSTRSKDIGWEIDLQATYDYTEDVSFGLLAGWFVPGSFYSSPNDATATDVVSSVKVSF